MQQPNLSAASMTSWLISHTEGTGCTAGNEEPVSMLDLPAPWLVQLIKQSDGASLLALFQTCVMLRDMVLRYAPTNSQLNLRPMQWGGAQSLWALCLSHQHGGRASRTLTCSDPLPAEQGMPATSWGSLVGSRMLAVLHAGLKMGLLHTVTQLKLYWVTLAVPLVPVISGLPNLNGLTIRSSTIDWRYAAAGHFAYEFKKLQHLRLEGVMDIGSCEPWQQHLKQQVAQLTSLTDLTLHVLEDHDHGNVVKAMGEAAMPTVAQQLTRLAVHTVPGYLDTPSSRAQLAVHLTALKVLHLPVLVIEDEDMPWLLGLPMLQHLQVASFQLSQSWAGQPCKWLTLSCNSFHTKDLALPPLHDKLVLKEHDTTEVNLTLGMPDTITAAITAAARSGLPRWQAVVILGSQVDGGVDLDLRFQLALPLLAAAKDLSVQCAGVSISSVAAYVQAAAAWHTEIWLKLHCACEGSVADIAELVSRMPAGSELQLGWLQADEELLVRLCSAIGQGVTMHVRAQEPSKGYQRRIRRASGRQGLWVEVDRLDGSCYITVWDDTPKACHSSTSCIAASSLSSNNAAAPSSQSAMMVSTARNNVHGSSSSSNAGGKSVLGCPVRWLVQLIRQLDTNSLWALFHTCKAFKRLVLRHTRHTWLTLQPAQLGQARSLTALQLADEHRKQVCLKIRDSGASQETGVARKELATHTVSLLQAGHSMGILDVVTQLDLWGVEVAAPLLPVLSDSLHNLEAFQLRSSTINWNEATQDSFRGSFSKLRYLDLVDVRDVGQHEAWQQHMKQQVATLIGLQVWKLCAKANEGCDAVTQAMSTALPAVARQLTYLHLDPVPAYLITPTSRALLAVRLAALKVLQLPELMIKDQDMYWLLNLPMLESLHIYTFLLSKCWAGKRCRWHTLSCTRIYTDALALLPLHNKLVIKGPDTPCVRLTVGPPDTITAAIAAVARSGLPRWHTVTVEESEVHTGVTMDLRFQMALPLLVGVSHLTLECEGVSISSVLAYLKAAAAQQQDIRLHLPCTCEGSAAEIAELVSHMPAGSELLLGWMETDEVLLSGLCFARRQGVTLHVSLQELCAGYQQRIQAAVAQRGQYCVQLEPYHSNGWSCVTVQDAAPNGQHSLPSCIASSSLSSNNPAAPSSSHRVSMAHNSANGSSSSSSNVGGKSVLGFPVRWLKLLIKQLDADGLLALFRTCKAFRRLVLRRTTLTRLDLQPALVGEAQLLTALRLVHKHSKQVCLKITDSGAVQQTGVASKELATYTYSLLQAGHSLGILNVVTQLYLWGIELAAPLLPVLSNSLPNLTTLQLRSSTINWSEATEDSFTGSFSNLQDLHLLGVRDVGPIKAWQEYLKQQLATLTSLNSLTLCADGSGGYDALSQAMCAALPAVAHQLTYLRVDPVPGLLDTPRSRTQLRVHLTALKELWLTGPLAPVFEDDDMPWLLDVPSLQRLHIRGFHLRQSWAGRQCSWQEVSCTKLHTDELARLPLHNKLAFKGALTSCISLQLGTRDSVAAAVKAVVNSRLPGWPSVEVHAADNQGGNLDERFLLASPMLADTSDLQLYLPGLSVDSMLAYVWFLSPAQRLRLHLKLHAPYEGSVADIPRYVSFKPAGIGMLHGALTGDGVMLVELPTATHGSCLHVCGRLPNKQSKLQLRDELEQWDSPGPVSGQ